MDESLALGVIAEQLGVPVDSLSAETAFADLNADSLELFQIIVALAEKCDIEFDNDRAESIKLVRRCIGLYCRAGGCGKGRRINMNHLNLEEFERKIAYTFSDKNLLILALNTQLLCQRNEKRQP